MYFGWVTPALMALMVKSLPGLTERPVGRKFYGVIGATLALAMLAYPLFLLYGYRAVDLAGRRFPLSTIAASLNILAWYVFGALYLRATWQLSRSAPLRLWDAALAFLFLSSLGAWGRGMLVALKVTDPFWETAMVHLFLDLFSDGWFLLSLLGLVYVAAPSAWDTDSRRGTRLIILGLPVTFLLGVPVDLTPITARLIAGVGGGLVTAGLLVHLGKLWPVLWQQQNGAWRMPLVFLGVRALAGLTITVPAIAGWAERAGLRVSYLHWFLLGFVTLGLFAAAEEVWGYRVAPGRKAMTAAVLFLLVTLIPLTRIWPASWGGRWTVQLAAWGTVAPLLVSGGALVTAIAAQRSFVRLWRVLPGRNRSAESTELS
jgi:hypothetical protein